MSSGMMTTDGFDQRAQPGDVDAALAFLSRSSVSRCNFPTWSNG
jgi:hypothetical protein